MAQPRPPRHSAVRSAGRSAGRLKVAAELAGPFRQHGTAQQGRAGIEAAVGIADHPAALPPAGLGRLTLGLHLQGNAGEFIAAMAQLVAVVPLQHQETALAQLKPTARVGHLLQLQLLEQLAGASLEQVHPHQEGAWGRGSGTAGLRAENPQAKSKPTTLSSTHSGGTSWGATRRTIRRTPTRPTAR